MKEAEHAYQAPKTTSRIPDGLADYLDGTGLLSKTQALRLSTLSADGWTHAALLSAGDMVVMPSGRLRFALFPQSNMVSNLEREGRLPCRFHSTGGCASCCSALIGWTIRLPMCRSPCSKQKSRRCANTSRPTRA
jgi:hypothetical protein